MKEAPIIVHPGKSSPLETHHPNPGEESHAAPPRNRPKILLDALREVKGEKKLNRKNYADREQAQVEMVKRLRENRVRMVSA